MAVMLIPGSHAGSRRLYPPVCSCKHIYYLQLQSLYARYPVTGCNTGPPCVNTTGPRPSLPATT
jgi:hypothetical protein